MLYPVNASNSAINLTGVQNLKNSVKTTWSAYMEKLQSFFPHRREVAKTAESFSNTHPILGTPSGEKAVEKEKTIQKLITSRDKLNQIAVDYPSNSTTAKVVKTFGSVEAFAKLPELQWDDRFHRGGTGYIDGIHPNDMKSPVMWGIDRWNRLFVAVKSNLKQVSTENGSMKDLGVGVETFFQRYSDEGDTWVSGGHFGHSVVLVSSTIDANILEIFQKLIKGQPVDKSQGWKGEESRYILSLQQ